LLSGGDWICGGVVVNVDCVARLEVHGTMSSSNDPVGTDDGTPADTA